MKKIFSVLIAFFAVFLMSCKNDVSGNSSMPNLKSIKDFAKYKSIGAGSVSSTRSARSADGSVYVDPEEGVKLIGELSDGSIELIKFIDEEGNITEQTWYLHNLHINSTFAFLSFSPYKTSIVTLNNEVQNSYDNYVLDLTTGNLYSLSTFCFRCYPSDNYKIVESFDKNGNKVTFATGKILEGNESVYALESGDYPQDLGIYTFSIEEIDNISKLKISCVYPFESNFPKLRAVTDVYGNIYGKSACEEDFIDDYDFVIYSKGKISTVTDKFYLNKFDNKFYSYEYSPNSRFEVLMPNTDENISYENCYWWDYCNYILTSGSPCKYNEKTINSEGEVVFNTSESFPCYIDVYQDIKQAISGSGLNLKYFQIYKNYTNALFIQKDYELEKLRTETRFETFNENTYEVDYDIYKITISDINLHEVTYNKNGSIAEDKVTPLSEAYSNFKQDTTPVMTNETDIIVSYSGSLEENASVIFYKYNIDTNTTDTILTVDKIYGIEQNNKYIYLYTYDADWHKLEYYIYPDGSVKNEYKDYSNHKIYLVPIA